MKPEREPTFREKLILLWGKVRRYYYHTARPGYIARNHRRRRGECARCGICCYMGALCPHYAEDDAGQALCSRHPIRPRNCRIFPIDERDLAERDILLPGTPCGYSFVSAEEAAGASAAAAGEDQGAAAAEGEAGRHSD